jgi:hypothetical protein
VLPLAGQDFLAACAVFAAHEVGVFAALGDAPRSAAALAAVLGVGAHRLRALLDVLRLEGAARLEDRGYRRADVPPRPPAPPPHGWGRLAEVLRRDRPLDDEPHDARRFHAHLAEAGAATAREVAARLPPGSLLDLGGGGGGYSGAYLDYHPSARATLVERPAVLPLARERLGDRARLLAGDLLDPGLEVGTHQAALLANVLHLYPPAICQELSGRAAAAVEPGGVVAIVEPFLEPDRSGPPASVLFSLNMAIYTEGGAGYDPGELAAFLTSAGLAAPGVARVAGDAVLIVATR